MSNIQKAQVTKEVNGLEMGVLDDGTPFLSMRGITRLCGVSNAHLSETAKAWNEGRPGATGLGRFLQASGLSASESLYTALQAPKTPAGTQYAFSDHVCSLILEYYAFESDSKNPTALQNYRITSRAGLRLFIYTQLGYDPLNLVPQPWRQFHDRVTMVSAPTGFFSVFKESADFIIHAIRNDLPVDSGTVPDISIGKVWGAYWTKETLEEQFGKRVKFDHNYPEYFPQAASNPQDMWVYPVAALPHFRVWLQTDYVREKFPAYLSGKVAKGMLPASSATILLLEVGAPVPPALAAKLDDEN